MELIADIEHLVDRLNGRVGITDLSPFEDVFVHMTGRDEDGSKGRLGFTYKDPAVATQPAASFPWGQSIVVVAAPYLRQGDGASCERSVARFADGDRYADLVAVLDAVAALLVTRGYRAETVFDDDRLVDRAVAHRAGVGWWGKSTMILTPRHGPWILIGSVVTNAHLPRGEPMVRSCGTCDACMPACPTGAIVAPGVLDARRCLAAVFQTRGDIPMELRSLAGRRIYGCDDCLTSCPPGQRSIESLGVVSEQVTARDALGMSDHDLALASDHWYVPGNQIRFVRRNALVALGNEGDRNDLGVIAGYAGHPDAMLRRHALWALWKVAPEVFASMALRIIATDADELVRRDVGLLHGVVE